MKIIDILFKMADFGDIDRISEHCDSDDDDDNEDEGNTKPFHISAESEAA